MQRHGSLEAVLAALDPAKHKLPEPYPFQEARQLFHSPRWEEGGR